MCLSADLLQVHTAQSTDRTAHQMTAGIKKKMKSFCVADKFVSLSQDTFYCHFITLKSRKLYNGHHCKLG